MNGAIFSALLLLLTGQEVTPDEGNRTIAELSQHKASPKSYTFDLHVGILVHTFPPLRFHFDGQGECQRTAVCSVDLHHLPWFGKGFEHVSLGPLDPSTWSKQYTVASIERTNEQTVLVMHDRRKSRLSEARATVDARSGLRQMIWTYDYGGRIQLDVNSHDVSGFPLPESDVAEIVMPSLKVTAHADFTNYRVVLDDADSTVAP